MRAVIDVWPPVVPTPELMKYVAEHFPQEMYGYLRIFFGQPVSDPSLVATFLQRMVEGRSFDDFLAALDRAHIVMSCLSGFDEETSCGVRFIPNALIAPLLKSHGDRFIGFAGVDPLKGPRAVEELEACVREQGFRGLALRPFMLNIPASDRRCYPLYEKCVELNIPVSIHSSANWTTMRINDLGHPRHIDQAAADFPDLKVIASHAGYPWVLEMCVVSWKHPHVYIDIAAHRPKYLAYSGSGWEPLLRLGSTVIKDKVLFGSGWFLFGRLPDLILEEFLSLPLSEEVKELWLYRNAKELLGLPEG